MSETIKRFGSAYAGGYLIGQGTDLSFWQTISLIAGVWLLALSITLTERARQ